MVPAAKAEKAQVQLGWSEATVSLPLSRTPPPQPKLSSSTFPKSGAETGSRRRGEEGSLSLMHFLCWHPLALRGCSLKLSPPHPFHLNPIVIPSPILTRRTLRKGTKKQILCFNNKLLVTFRVNYACQLNGKHCVCFETWAQEETVSIFICEREEKKKDIPHAILVLGEGSLNAQEAGGNQKG